MRGIPFKCNEEDVVNFFKPTSIEDIRFPKDKKGRPSGYAFVDFTTLDDAIEAMKKDGKKLKGRYVELFSEKQEKPVDSNRKYGKDGEWLNKVCVCKNNLNEVFASLRIHSTIAIIQTTGWKRNFNLPNLIFSDFDFKSSSYQDDTIYKVVIHVWF